MARAVLPAAKLQAIAPATDIRQLKTVAGRRVQASEHLDQTR